jgi:hypothetical protein
MSVETPRPESKAWASGHLPPQQGGMPKKSFEILVRGLKKIWYLPLDGREVFGLTLSAR